MKELLLDMKAEVEQAREAGKQQLAVQTLAHLLGRSDELLTEGYRANPPPGAPKKSAQSKRTPGKARLAICWIGSLAKKQAVLRFLHDFAVPFDNNQAERNLRMVKVQQKVSGCFRTEEGIARFCRIRSYLSTLRKQGIALLSALNRTLSGNPVLPAFS